MNNIKTIIACVLLFAGKLAAQESFLVFDSIQIVENEHILTRQGSIGGVIDTISIQVLPNQYIKINNVSLSIRSTSFGVTSAHSSNTMTIDDYDRYIYDMRIDLNKINLINTSDFGRQTVGLSSYVSKTNNLGVTKKVGILLKQGTYDLVVKYSGYFSGSSGTDRTLNSRLELIHFSEE